MSLYNRQLPQTLVTGCVGTDCSLEWLINLEEENGQDNYRTIVHFQALMYVEAIHPSICPLILSRVVGGGAGAYPRIEYIFKQNWRYIQCIQFRFRCFSSIHVFFKGNIWDQNNLSVSFSLDEAKNSPQNNRANGSHYCRGSGFRFSLKFVTI